MIGILMSMRIRVLLFGVLREAISPSEQVLELGPSATAEAVLEHYRRAAPALGGLWNTVAIAVNQHYAAAGTSLSDGDEVALLPPVSGGTDREPVGEPSTEPSTEPVAKLAWLTRQPIDAARILAELKAGPDGALVTFDGVVRNNTRGRETLFLVYEAYEAMALTQMHALVEQALVSFPVRAAVLVHRLGRLEVGESSVLIAVASAHRGAAFDACRWLIDTLKKTVPLWKKEHFLDGAVWADGEPFPAALVAEEKQP